MFAKALCYIFNYCFTLIVFVSKTAKIVKTNDSDFIQLEKTNKTQQLSPSVVQLPDQSWLIFPFVPSNSTGCINMDWTNLNPDESEL